MQKIRYNINVKMGFFLVKKNYFFLSTAAIALTIILLYAIGGNSWQEVISVPYAVTGAPEPSRLIRTFLNAFSSYNAAALTLSVLGFLICGLFLERRLGSINFFVLVILMTFFTSTATAVSLLHENWQGFIIVVYGLLAFIVLDFLRLFFRQALKHSLILKRNLFFITSTFFVLLNIILYALGGSTWQNSITNNTARSIANAFAHLDAIHLTWNVLGFLFCGVYLERKLGSGKWFIIALLLTYFTAIISVTSVFSATHWIGFSGVVYTIYGFVIIDFITSIIKGNKAPTNLILGITAIIFMYLNFSFCRVNVFRPYPHSLLFHMGHLFSFIGGVVLGLILNIMQRLKTFL